MKKILIAIANGSEDIEAITLVDVLSVHESKEVLFSHKTKVTADEVITVSLSKGPYDLIAIPGGMPGATNLSKSAALQHLLQEQNSAGRLIGAICASPAVVLDSLGISKDKNITCYPGFEKDLKYSKFSNERVVRSGNIITAQAPGSALEFALELVKAVGGVDAAEKVRAPMYTNFL